MRRPLAAIVSIVLCGAALEPLLRAPGDPDSDDFPLSTYPMFAAPRPAELTLAWARGMAPGGGSWMMISPSARQTDAEAAKHSAATSTNVQRTKPFRIGSPL